MQPPGTHVVQTCGRAVHTCGQNVHIYKRTIKIKNTTFLFLKHVVCKKKCSVSVDWNYIKHKFSIHSHLTFLQQRLPDVTVVESELIKVRKTFYN